MVSNGHAPQKIIMNLPESIRQWIYEKQPEYPALGGANVYIDGESSTAEPPMIVIDETGSTQTNQDGVPIRGVNTITIAVQLHTIPSTDGTSAPQARAMQDALFNVVADIDGLKAYADTRNGARVLDIFADSPIISADDGRRVATVNLEILAFSL